MTDEALDATAEGLSKEELAVVRLQKMQRGQKERARLQAEHAAATKVQAVQRGNAARSAMLNPNVNPARRVEDMSPEEVAAATKVQSIHRGALERRQLEVDRKAATKVQAAQRGKNARRPHTAG